MQNGLRTDPDLFENRWHDAFFVLDQRGEDVQRHQLGIAVLGSDLIGTLESLLRL